MMVLQDAADQPAVVGLGLGVLLTDVGRGVQATDHRVVGAEDGQQLLRDRLEQGADSRVEARRVAAVALAPDG